ncbi:hypothetical protein HYN48_14025 [Flavobacterium magnum]|uniref:Uncharacterized protein n=1 Tax=Flavobacterium magnum TaxID=2162713 RepID=A0A2S0RGQ1_9FLAO|nr:hypothetical protein HYN48_14025 [Flavobacterium magnum]
MQLIRSKSPTDYIIVQHIFFSKQTYLAYKEFLQSNGKLYNTETENNELSLKYIYDSHLVILQTKTFDSTTLYLITLSSEKLN